MSDKKSPDQALYEAARSLRENEHIKSLVFHDEYYRDIIRKMQGPYTIKQLHWPNQGYGFRIRTIWDHDRIWGTFALGFFKGVFLVDPGPGQDHFQADDEYDHQHPYDGTKGCEDDVNEDSSEHEDDPSKKEYQLAWRGTSTQAPDTIFYSNLTIGKIRFGLKEIWGHFDAMMGVGLPNDRCEFHGKQPFGPPVVRHLSFSIHGVIDDWNELGLFCDDEKPRQGSAKADDATNDKIRRSSPPSSPIAATSSSRDEAGNMLDENEQTESESDDGEWTLEEGEQFLKFVSGIFKITSDAVEEEWPRMSQGLKIRLHVDEEIRKIWGQFDVGIEEGYFHLCSSPNEIMPGSPIDFQWRGRMSETGEVSSGKGEITIDEGSRIRGTFHGMCGDIDFKGRRQLMPAGISGREVVSYRQGWENYRPMW